MRILKTKVARAMNLHKDPQQIDSIKENQDSISFDEQRHMELRSGRSTRLSNSDISLPESGLSSTPKKVQPLPRTS